MSALVHSTAEADAPTGALAHLADVAMPPPVAWTPQTIGWPVAGALLLVAALWAGWRWLRRYRANRYRRAALAELAVLRPLLEGADDARGAALLALAALLKRTTLAAWPREAVAPLSGTAWARFLAENAGPVPDAAKALARLIDDAEYRPPAVLGRWSTEEARAVADAARQWIARHRMAKDRHVHP